VNIGKAGLNGPLAGQHERETAGDRGCRRKGGWVSRKGWIGFGVASVLGVTALALGAWWSHERGFFSALPGHTAPIEEIREAYGPPNYSQGEEETLIRAFFKDRTGGFFLDVGASHFQKDSTTYYLEKHLGWRGIAVDALEEFRSDYERFRKGTQFFAFFVSNRTDTARDFYVYTRDTRISSGSIEQLRGLPRVKDRYIKKTEVPTITLDRLLSDHGVQKVDFVSMDIEGSEPEALEGFDIERYRPDLICIEVQTYTRDRLYDYFAAHGYAPIQRYRPVDAVNHYFERKS
jgi:FkbM family methyltransferase